jgi:histidine ammonia-lyase
MIERAGQDLTIEALVAVARRGALLAALREDVRARMQRSHDWVERSIRQTGKVIYGVNTGFGSLANR